MCMNTVEYWPLQYSVQKTCVTVSLFMGKSWNRNSLRARGGGARFTSQPSNLGKDFFLCLWDLTPGINLFLTWQLCGQDSARTHEAPLAMHKLSLALHQCQDITSGCGEKNSVLPNMVWSPVLVNRDGHPHLMTSNNKRLSPSLTDLDTFSYKVWPPLSLVISLCLHPHLWLAYAITWEL